MNTQVLKVSRSVTAIMAILCLVGCQKAVERVGPKLFPAEGKILIDGKIPVGATIRFCSPQTSIWGRMPIAVVRQDGTYAVSFSGKEDGIPAGDYDLIVYWLEIPPEGGLPKDRLMGEYCEPTKPAAKVTIIEGSNQLEPIQLTTSVDQRRL